MHQTGSPVVESVGITPPCRSCLTVCCSNRHTHFQRLCRSRDVVAMVAGGIDEHVLCASQGEKTWRITQGKKRVTKLQEGSWMMRLMNDSNAVVPSRLHTSLTAEPSLINIRFRNGVGLKLWFRSIREEKREGTGLYRRSHIWDLKRSHFRELRLMNRVCLTVMHHKF